MINLSEIKKKNPKLNYLLINKDNPDEHKMYVRKESAKEMQAKVSYDSVVLTFREATRIYPYTFWGMFDRRGGSYYTPPTVPAGFGGVTKGDEARKETISLRVTKKVKDIVQIYRDNGITAGDLFEAMLIDRAKADGIIDPEE